MVKRRRNHPKAKRHQAKPRFTLLANQFHQQQITPCLKKYRQAMKAKRYKDAGEAFATSQQLYKEYRLLLARKEKIRIR